MKTSFSKNRSSIQSSVRRRTRWYLLSMITKRITARINCTISWRLIKWLKENYMTLIFNMITMKKHLLLQYVPLLSINCFTSTLCKRNMSVLQVFRINIFSYTCCFYKIKMQQIMFLFNMKLIQSMILRYVLYLTKF